MEFDLDTFNRDTPSNLDYLINASKNSGFDMCSDLNTGCLLRLLASSKPNGNILEIGTGTGLSALWLLEGMCPNSKLLSIDNDRGPQGIAKDNISDSRVTFLEIDGMEFLREPRDEKFDIIFADAWPGKYELIEEAFNLLADGGIYIVDDFLPQDDWPPEHYPDAEMSFRKLSNISNTHSVGLNWSTGLLIMTKKASTS
ncbi:SAM-dependent methyltransferase [Idiomarina tyrosinivorans]|uniref:SAM-dependent methyltransferase n=1 Tax=Idiomarina tyrosinivorans TaxID=1445662 RepID=A0A432ZSX3_9GAMM|nr:class I SAM-dependent methyltransferase [Idiomarina tyrosinivorans]RUO80962.1 SAM-dependent methyltransferase [Idiomarina tyrosinivorans]